MVSSPEDRRLVPDLTVKENIGSNGVFTLIVSSQQGREFIIKRLQRKLARLVNSTEEQNRDNQFLESFASKIYDETIVPFMAEEMSAEAAIVNGSSQIKEFMVKNTRKNDLSMFSDMSGTGNYEGSGDVPFSVILPAFITSELKTAFQIGFLLFLPFLVIDMVIASILMSLGMMMLSPMLVSLPFKLLLFVIVDGWAMTVGSLASTFVAV